MGDEREGTNTRRVASSIAPLPSHHPHPQQQPQQQQQQPHQPESFRPMDMGLVDEKATYPPPPMPVPSVVANASTSSRSEDRIEQRLRVIETHTSTLEAQHSAVQSQLAATQQLIQTLTQVVLGLERAVAALAPERVTPRGPNAALVETRHVTPTPSPTLSPVAVEKPIESGDHEPKPKKPIGRYGRMNSAGLELMSRTISVQGMMGGPGGTSQHRSSLMSSSLAAAASLVRRLTLGTPTDGPSGPDSPVANMTKRASAGPMAADDVARAVAAAGRPRGCWWWSYSLGRLPRVLPVANTAQRTAARWDGVEVHALTIRHDSNARFVWDAFVMVVILADVVLMPLALSFGCCTRLYAFVDVAATSVFGVDMMVLALSSYTTKRGVLVSGPKNTIPHYVLSMWAVADALSSFPFEYFVASGRFLGLAKVIRLVKFSQLMRRFQSARKAGMFRLIRLISIVLLVSHLLACYWNWVAKVWRLNKDGYVDKTTLEQYVHCWSIVIGSLNASPPLMHTPIEEISVALFMLIGNVLQATVFGSVAALIQSFDEEEVAYNKKLISTYERCKLLDIPEPLAQRITRYYEHLYRETHSVDPDANAFISELSPALICEVKFLLYRDMVRQIPFFAAASINPVLIEALILRLRTVIYMQDDMLFRKGEFGDWMGFLGSKGSVGVLGDSSHQIVRVLRKGDYFGETGLLHRVKRLTTAVALSGVQVHVLSRGDMDFVKDLYAEDTENLEHEIRKYMKSRVARVMQNTPALPLKMR